ncbi:MAG: amidohydrolase [Fusobacteriaceae bacterium]
MKLIKNALLMDCKERECKLSNIYFENGIITKVTKANEEIQGVINNIIDANGLYVSSGLIDAHTHLGLSGDSQGFEGRDYNELNDPVTPEMRAIDGINPQDVTFKEALLGGVTTVGTGPGSANVIGGQYACIKTYGNRVDKMIVKFPMAMKVAFGENPKRVYNEKNKTPITRMGIAALLRETLEKTKEYMADSNRKYNMKLEAMIPVLKGEIPLKAHCHRGDDILTAIRIAKEFNLKLTLEHVTCATDILEELLEEDYPLLVGPTFGSRPKIELKAKSFENVAKLSNAGKDIAIITDAPVVPLEYLVLSAGLAVEAGMDEWKALEAITINPAKYMGVADKVGSIDVGKDADIVIWKKHPLLNITSPKVVIAGGEIVSK